MAEQHKKPFIFHVSETRHYEFVVWDIDEAAARERGSVIWRDADTVGQWELPDEEVDYHVTPKAVS